MEGSISKRREKEKSFAKHIILELWDAKNTNSPATVKKALNDACRRGNLNLVRVFIHQFSPHGVSGVAAIAESHITIHTWPEYSFAAVDIYSCDNDADINKVAQVIRTAFDPGEVNQVEIRRGRTHPLARLG